MRLHLIVANNTLETGEEECRLDKCTSFQIFMTGTGPITSDSGQEIQFWDSIINIKNVAFIWMFSVCNDDGFYI